MTMWFEDEYREMVKKEKQKYEDTKAQRLWDQYKIKYADLVRIDYIDYGIWRERDNSEDKKIYMTNDGKEHYKYGKRFFAWHYNSEHPKWLEADKNYYGSLKRRPDDRHGGVLVNMGAMVNNVRDLFLHAFSYKRAEPAYNSPCQKTVP